jgi:hypothetical protein
MLHYADGTNSQHASSTALDAANQPPLLQLKQPYMNANS